MMNKLLFAISLQLLSIPVLFSACINGAEIEDSEVLATWSGIELHNCEFEKYLANIPEEEVGSFILSKERVSDLGQQALINKKILSLADIETIESGERFQKKLALLKESLMIDAYRSQYLEEQALESYDAQAREYYLANQERFTIPEVRKVKHVLINTSERTSEEALSSAETILDEIRNDEISFDEAIEKYSDDTGSKGANAILTVSPGAMVAEFERAVNDLSRIGEISVPIKTQFGYHLIKYESYEASQVADYERYEDQLLDYVAGEHRKKVWERHLQSFSLNGDPVVNTDAMTVLLEKVAASSQSSVANN